MATKQSPLSHIGSVTSFLSLQRYFDHHSWKTQFAFAQRVSRYGQFYLVGADMLDGYYSDEYSVDRVRLVELAARVGVRAHIVGISFNNNPTEKCVQALLRLPPMARITARDPISLARLQQHTGRPIELVADVAFSLEPAKDSSVVQTTLSWVREQKNLGRTIVGVNVNYLILREVAGLTPEALVLANVRFIIELFEQASRISIVLLPHDFRMDVSDVSLSRDVLAQLPDEVKHCTMQLPTPFNATDIKAIVAELDIVLSGRMHLAIACLGQGTPVACIVYQDKFEGLYQHFGLSNLTLDPNRSMQPQQISQFLLPHIHQSDVLRKQIQFKLPQILQLAKLNFVPPA
jgi:polysaccharide pyruvyl transferase WcaK-like protein